MAKEKRLNEIFGKVSSHVRLVAIDFDHEDFRAALSSNGCSSTGRTFFVWEGASQYLTEEGVRKIFDSLARAAPGSCLAFTYVCKDFLDGRAHYRWDSGHKRFVATKVWRFGLVPDSVEGFLIAYGWDLIEDVGYDELARRYIAPSRRGLASTPVERIVYAEKRRQQPGYGIEQAPTALRTPCQTDQLISWCPVGQKHFCWRAQPTYSTTRDRPEA